MKAAAQNIFLSFSQIKIQISAVGIVNPFHNTQVSIVELFRTRSLMQLTCHSKKGLYTVLHANIAVKTTFMFFIQFNSVAFASEWFLDWCKVECCVLSFGVSFSPNIFVCIKGHCCFPTPPIQTAICLEVNHQIQCSHISNVNKPLHLVLVHTLIVNR